jgi:hypothetical protein
MKAVNTWIVIVLDDRIDPNLMKWIEGARRFVSSIEIDVTNLNYNERLVLRLAEYVSMTMHVERLVSKRKVDPFLLGDFIASKEASYAARMAALQVLLNLYGIPNKLNRRVFAVDFLSNGRVQAVRFDSLPDITFSQSLQLIGLQDGPTKISLETHGPNPLLQAKFAEGDEVINYESHAIGTGHLGPSAMSSSVRAKYYEFLNELNGQLKSPVDFVPLSPNDLSNFFRVKTIGSTLQGCVDIVRGVNKMNPQKREPTNDEPSRGIR